MSMQCFAILPYLKTSGTVTIRGIDFKGSVELGSLDPPTKQHLLTLFSLFFLKDDLRIKEMSYAYLEITDKSQQNEQATQRLAEVHHLLAYLYSSPHPTFLDPFLKREHANLYVFTPQPVSQFLIRPDNPDLESVSPEYPYPISNEWHEMPGYQGILNNESYLRVAKGSRVYPPSSGFWLNLSQDLHVDLLRSLPSSRYVGFGSLIEAAKPRLGLIEDRIFTALKWYNRSNSVDVGDDVALLHLAIAFESLLALEQGPQITQRFKESVGLLVGSVPKLENWTGQFYAARSKIVHEGSSPDMMFCATQRSNRPSAEYRSLVSYGHIIFGVCLNAIVAGADTAYQTGLASLLTTNQERFEQICKVLANANPGSPDALLSLRREVMDIDEYKFIPEDRLRIDTMLMANRLVVQHAIATNPPLSSELLGLYSSLANAQTSQDRFDELETIIQIVKHIGAYESARFADPADPTALLFSLTRSVHHYTFRHYYVLKNVRDKGVDDSYKDDIE